MKAAEMRKEIKLTDSTINDLTKHRDAVHVDLVKKVCPFKVGDRVTACGYSFEGKTMEVTEIKPKIFTVGFRNKREYGWMAYGKVVKANGKTGTQRTNFDSVQYANAKKKAK